VHHEHTAAVVASETDSLLPQYLPFSPKLKQLHLKPKTANCFQKTFIIKEKEDALMNERRREKRKVLTTFQRKQCGPEKGRLGL